MQLRQDSAINPKPLLSVLAVPRSFRPPICPASLGEADSVTLAPKHGSQEAMGDPPIPPLREGKRIMHGSLTEVRQAKRGPVSPGLSAK
eukprot:2070701-Prymnesium_polylepis.1